MLTIKKTNSGLGRVLNIFTCVAVALLFCFASNLRADGEASVKQKITKLILNDQIEWDFYGKIKFDLMYDSAQFIKYNDFIGAVANREITDDEKNDSTNFNPRDTRFGVWGKYRHGNWEVKGRFAIDFYGSPYGNNLQPRMRLGYIDLKNTKTNTSLLAGQDWTPIATLNPSTIDFGILGGGGNIWWRVPQVTLRQEFKNNWEMLISAMKHRRTNTANEDRMPWLLSRISKDFQLSELKGMLAVGGGYRRESYGGEDSDHDLKRWLISGELKASFKRFSLKGEYWFADGVGGSFQRYDLDVNSQTCETISAQGGWLDFTYKFTPKLSATLGGGFDNPEDDEMLEKRKVEDLNNRQFTKNQVAYFNVWYQLFKPLRIGAEYMRVDTERDMDTDSGNRFAISMEFKF